MLYKPRSVIVEPVFDDFKTNSTIVGIVVAVEPWTSFFEKSLPDGINGIVADVKESCGSEFTYVINGPQVDFDGTGDRHDPKYNDMAYHSSLTAMPSLPVPDNETGVVVVGESSDQLYNCGYSVSVYPSSSFEESFQTQNPIIYASVMFAIFATVALVFVIYDCIIQKRQNKVLLTAQRTKQIITSLFPKEVGRRLVEEATKQQEEAERQAKGAKLGASKVQNAPAKKDLHNFLNEGGKSSMDLVTGRDNSKPIAEVSSALNLVVPVFLTKFLSIVVTLS
jgi:hypothetical protein